MPEGVDPRLTVALTVAFALVIYLLWPRQEIWTAVVYPNAADLLVYETIGDFDTLEECLGAVQARVAELAEPSLADFECGLNCEPADFDAELSICDETRDTL